MVDYKAIEQLIKTLSESNLTTLEIESDGMKIKMCKEEKVIIKNYLQLEKNDVSDKKVYVKENNEYKQENQQIKVKDNEAVQDKLDNIDIDDKNIEVVKSPIVGTFYAASGPEQDDFVKLGSKVKTGDTLCIIEAMKLMNEISSEVDGEIVEILVNDQEMVEYGQPLFKIRKTI